jgi:uncharacterized repeat protein (TIGR01451 family)/fimbrial isopeptide formation D2 family protein
LREPVPGVNKSGWNVDAGQSEGQATATVYGNNNDDVIWRLGFTNTGRAPLEDLIFDDTMVPGNMLVNYVCTSAAAATNVANNNGVGPGACYATYRDKNGALRAVTNSIQQFAVDDPFGNPSNDESATYIDVPANGSAYIYLIGKLQAAASCSAPRTNTLSNIEWGCEVDHPDGGITHTSTGGTPGTATTTLRSRYGDVNAALTVNRRLTGTNTGQPVGTKGTMTITITNNTGGSVKFTDTLAYHLRDTLPVEYVMDPTYTPTIAVTSIYGSYAGRINTITWSNPAPGTFPLNTSDSTSYLNNTVPEFMLSSSTVHPNYPDQQDMMRQGDVLTITFRVVLINSDYYDRTANLDVTPEDNTVLAQNTDPDPGQQITLSNTLNVRYDTFCSTQGTQTLTLLGNGTANPGTNNNIPADPEDLDIAIGGGVFILTNDPAQILTLPVLVTNNGGHQAAGHHIFVTFGATMEMVSAPAGCSLIHSPSGTPAVPDEWQPDPWKVWIKNSAVPISIPSTATVYQCTTPATITPGQTVTFNFGVSKTTNAARIALDDLTFRADVVGEIALSNGTPLWFPTPSLPARADGELDRANNYSLDAVWARVIGFNLKKTQSGTCNENNPPSYDGNGYEEVQVGEECIYYIDTGGWFGFETPGFAYIAVQNIDVVDELEDAPNYGQAYISNTDPYATSTSGIKNVVLAPAGLLPVTEGWFDWRFNVADADRIEVADEWFRVYVTTRVLNDAIDSSAAPNLHGANSHNILNSTFDATFQNNNTGLEETYTLGPGTIGYPNEPLRRVDLTITEPNILVTKQVCNETLYGTGTGCSNFVDLADDGDTHDSYIYKVVLTNEAASGGVARAPAYDVITTDILDASDLVLVVPFGTDGLDNDGDGLVDAADTEGESTVSENIVDETTQAIITNSYTHSSSLLRIDPGASNSVTFYYRVDPDDRVAPQQQLVNQITASYDSLAGGTNESGNQTVDLRSNSDIGGARVYTSTAATATVQILSVTNQPKYITGLANTSVGSTPQAVSIGEEVEYELLTRLPVANLRNFIISDQLPTGLRCSEAPVVDLDAAPYNAAGFSPGGQITPTCTDNLVKWDFGNRLLTTKPPGVTLFEFPVRFIGRVENTTDTDNGDVIANGHPVTNATVSYENEAGSTVVLNFGQVDILVREPQIALTKKFAVANADAADILTVTVDAENTGTATAYNLQILDDLVGLNLTFIGNVSGSDPPDNIDTTTLGANRPIFSWNMPAGIAPGIANAISFTFEVRVDNVVQPHEVLDNTIQARWTSLPGQTTALNSTGLIGADGTATGMRIGVLPNAGDAVNDYETSAANQVTVPAVTMTKTDLSSALVPTIGVHKNFQIEIQLPEGISNNVLVTDSLNAAGISYVLENNGAYDITYTFQNIATINGLAPSETSLNTFPADGETGSIVWNIGTVVTQTENDTVDNAINPVIRINYYARINNDLVTDETDPLQNSVVVNYTNGETGVQESLTDSIQVTVVEPVLTVNKAATLVTPAPLSGGSILEYAITINNSGTSEAYDVNVVDTLPSELLLYGGFTPTATIGGTAVAGFSATPAGAPSGPLVWGRGNGDNSLDIPDGETLVLTYQTQVQVSTTTTFNNEVWVDWTSLDNEDSFERTGAGCPTVTAPDDYCVGPASVTSSSTDNNQLTKSVVSDSYVDALSTASDATVRIGDTVTYRLSLALGEGLTRSVQVTDVLPSGMDFENLVSISPVSGGNFTYTVTTQPVAGQTGTLTWNFGDITNQPSNDNTPNDTLVIEYVAKVLPDGGISHVATTTLTNTATLHYLDINGTPVVDPSRLENQAVITVWQPVINQVTKTDRSGRTSPASVIIATDIMQFRLEACNNGPAPAYSIQVTDQLASQLDETSIANLVVSAGGSALTAGSDYTYTPPALRGGTMVFLLNTPVNPGECLTIDYDIRFHTDFGPQTWNNSATLDTYWSLPAQSGQLYGPVGPAIYAMNNVVNLAPPSKTIVSPASEAPIGEEIVYHITVPAVLKNAAIFDIIITDTLDNNLEYVSATKFSGNFNMIDNSVSPTQVSLYIDQVNAYEQAVIELHARVRNLVSANGGGTFTNTATYTYADSSGGATLSGGSDTTTPILIVEPSLTLAKSVVNVTNPGNPPVAGDILRYTLNFTAAGGALGDNFSDAFDLRIDDTLGLGLVYSGNPLVSNGSIGAPVTAGNGTTTPQTLLWSLADGNADIDIPEGTVVNVSYEVLVLDTVLIGQTLSNSVTAQWTSLDGAGVYERTGTGTPPLNDYFTGPVTTTITTGDTTTISKTRLQDTFVTSDANVRIGDIIDYELRLGLQEGSHDNLVVTDTLPQGLIFAGVVSVNGDSTAPYAAVAPFVHADINGTAIAVAGDPASGPTTVTWNLGDIVNQADGSIANDEFVLVYRARVLNEVLPQVNSTPLTNTVQLDYDTVTGPAVQTDSETITLLQPNLSVAKSAVASGGDTVLAANELVTYTVDITNNGSAPAYDTVLRDIIPVGMRNGTATITMISIELLSGIVLPNLAPAYDAATGIAIWNFDTGTADQYTIPAGDTLRIVYQVQAESAIGAGLTLANQAQVTLYYSFDDEAMPSLGSVTGVREIYGPSNVATTTLTTATPDALVKENPTVTTVAVGESFTYRITVPGTPQATDLYDVRILDDLTASAADLIFVSVTKISGSKPWTPVKTGTDTQFFIEDTTTGIDIPAGEQIVIDITVRLDDSVTNVSGLLFNNTASYTYDQVNDNPATQAVGGPDTTADMTIVGPDALTLEKSGPATVQLGTPGTFTLNLHNPSGGTAWKPTITDLLPNPGMCATPPANVTAGIYLADGVTPVSAPLVEGTHFTLSFDGTACQWTITLLSAAGGVRPDQRLIVTYDAGLDPGTVNGINLTNIAGVTQWFSADSATARTYTEVLTDGTPGTLDHEDNHTVATETPGLRIQKSVRNMTTSQDPGSDASPGDTLRYTIQIINTGPVGLASFALEDEVDRLNALAVFAPGSLTLITVPATGDSSGTSAVGGVHGTGLVRVDNLSIGPANDTVVVEFDITLAPAIDSSTVVLNQAQINVGGSVLLDSDDPNVNGTDDPAVVGDEDPTETLIASAPAFEVWKTSQDLTGDPVVLMAGDTLRYTITVKNIGNENTVNMLLRDQIPANTTYVPGSTTLNGVPEGDLSGVSKLRDGMKINSPDDPDEGHMSADVSPTANNVATITFDVVVNTDVLDGTIISNQAFLTGDGAGSGPIPENPSDDPGTATLDDPTRDVVGNLPLVDAQKTVQLVVDNGTTGILDPGDVLRYTITIVNAGAIPATNVVFTDAVPANTTYVANSVLLNTLPVGQPDGGISPLAAGIPVSSSDLTPPLPTAGNGTLSPGGSAVITFDVQVNGGVPTGTIISNQGIVNTSELPAEPTDADGIDSNGDQPTQIVVGAAQQLSITKEVFVVGGGTAEPGSQLEYVLRVTNIGSLAATNVVITDDLAPLAGQVTYVAGSGTLNSSTTGVSYAGSLLTADYASQYGDLASGAITVVRFRVLIEPTLPLGTTITNTGTVQWNSPAQSASASVSIDVGGVPGSASLNGSLWHDSNLDKIKDGTELNLAGWSVDLYQNSMRLGTAVTDANGLYRFSGLAPNDVSLEYYELRFRDPGAGTTTASMGNADSVFINGPQRISSIIAGAGANLQNLNLPIQPNGTVYNSVVRVPVAGARLTMLNAASGAPLPINCFDDSVQQNQVTLQDGFYKFDLNFSDTAACPAGSAYLIEVTPPATGYLPAPSKIIPPASDASTLPFSVPACPGSAADAVPATAGFCEVVDSAAVPPISVLPGMPGTIYHLHLILSNGTVPGQSQIFNNPIPIDPELNGAVAISKTSSLINVTKGALVPYTITVNNVYGVPLSDIRIEDRFPAGFKYVAGSARLDGNPTEPLINGRVLTWDGLTLQVNTRYTIQLLLVVGSGVSEGEYVNRARVFNNLTDGAASGEATATVQVIPDPDFDCTDVIGKVFDDVNLNGKQDKGENGMSGVRVVTTRGLIATTDEHGRFHITCAAVPDEDRGSNFILKLDERSLPTGFRVTTENPRVQRATRGKMMRFNFGATIHRVVRIDIADGVFEPDSNTMRLQWTPKIVQLIEELKKAPSVLRLSYLADVEQQSLVHKRLNALKKEITKQWDRADGGYQLVVESEIFWRRGAPVGGR